MKRKILSIIAALFLVTMLFTFTIQPAFAAADPIGANNNSVGISLSADLYQADGTTLVGGLPGVMAHVGQKVKYTVTLYVPVPPQIPAGKIGANYYGGDLNFTGPDGLVQTLAPMPRTQINPVSAINTYTWVVPTMYTINNSHKVGGYWTAYADYGNTTRFPAANFGWYKSDPEQNTASATTSHDFASPGQLTVNKVVELNGDSGSGLTRTFTINVVGPSYPAPGTNLTFHIVAGAPTDSPQVLNDLVLGTYTVSEVSPGSPWNAGGGGGVTLTVQNPSQSSTITNTFNPNPHTTMAPIDANPSSIPPGGGNVTITVTDTNDGNVGLTGVTVILSGIDAHGNPAFSGSPLTMTKTGELVGNGDAVMDVNEVWVFSNTVTIAENTVFTAVGHGFAGSTDVTGPSETQTRVVGEPPRVPGLSTWGIALIIVAFAGFVTLFSWQRRRHSQQTR